MLSQDDRARLAEIEHHLSADDPAFAARMRAPRRSRMPTSMLVLMTLLWVVAPVFAAFFGWAAVGAALLVAAVIEAGRRLRRRIARRSRTAPT